MDHNQKRKPSLLHSANKLFTTGFIESVLNQKNCSTLLAEESNLTNNNRKLEAQEKRYLESASKLYRGGDAGNHKRISSLAFHPDNLDLLVQKFLHKDTESTIKLNSSLGNFGEEILGDTFRQE